MKWSVLVLSVCTLHAHHEDYYDLLQNAPLLIEEKGDAMRGEIEILLDSDEIDKIEKDSGREVGIIGRDAYWTWINDAVQFPSGSKGVYGRIFFTAAQGDLSAGVAVMAFLPNGKVVLNCNYRHATRSWEIEIPRGGMEAKESGLDAARRETLEETGMCIDSLTLLGEVATDTGVIGSVTPVYKAIVKEKGDASPQESEAIEEILALSIDEIKEAFRVGYWEMEIREQKQKVPFRDAFLAYGLLQCLIQNSVD